MIKVEFKNVAWDTDGETFENCGLKENFVNNVDIDFDFNTSDDGIADMLSDWLSDNYGFCHNGFEYEIITANILSSADDETIKKFFDNSVEKMIDEDDDWKFIIPFAVTDDDEHCVSIMLLWEGGYDVDKNNKYIDENGYGINVCLVEQGTAPYMEDWKHLTDTCSMSDDYDSIIRWLKEQLKYCNY